MTVADSNIAIIGPTASGKSGLAMELARRLDAEILSVDSMQIYRGMDIGTAKPTATEQAIVRHHAIDVVDPTDVFSVANFVTLADATIADAVSRKVPLIIAGGTPLYFKSLFTGLFEGPSADPSIRERLSGESLETLHAKLVLVDPPAAARIHANDRRRVTRALEVFESTGKPISAHQTEWGSDGAARHDARWFGLSWEKDALNRRINARVKQMMADGWLDEVRTLKERFGMLSKTAAEATGYASLLGYLHRRCTLDEAIEQTKIATRQLARRQMKWFRRFENVTWLDGTKSAEQLADEVIENLTAKT